VPTSSSGPRCAPPGAQLAEPAPRRPPRATEPRDSGAVATAPHQFNDERCGTSMRRIARGRLLAAGVAATLATSVGIIGLSVTAQAAVSGAATGFAAQNGGTTGGAGGTTVRATTGTQIHAALCGRPSSSTPITIEVEGTITHAGTSKDSGSSCNTAAGVIELKQVSNVTIVGVGKGAIFVQVEIGRAHV